MKKSVLIWGIKHFVYTLGIFVAFTSICLFMLMGPLAFILLIGFGITGDQIDDYYLNWVTGIGVMVSSLIVTKRLKSRDIDINKELILVISSLLLGLFILIIGLIAFIDRMSGMYETSYALEKLLYVMGFGFIVSFFSYYFGSKVIGNNP